MRHLAQAAGAVAFALAAGACAVSAYEVSYDTVFDARAQSAVDREWIPDWLPEEAVSIHERHQPATGASILAATLPSARLPEACEAAGSPPEPVLSADWFPDPPDGAAQCSDGSWAVMDGTTILRWTPAEAAT